VVADIVGRRQHLNQKAKFDHVFEQIAVDLSAKFCSLTRHDMNMNMFGRPYIKRVFVVL